MQGGTNLSSNSAPDVSRLVSFVASGMLASPKSTKSAISKAALGVAMMLVNDHASNPEWNPLASNSVRRMERQVYALWTDLAERREM